MSIPRLESDARMAVKNVMLVRMRGKWGVCVVCSIATVGGDNFQLLGLTKQRSQIETKRANMHLHCSCLACTSSSYLPCSVFTITLSRFLFCKFMPETRPTRATLTNCIKSDRDELKTPAMNSVCRRLVAFTMALWILYYLFLLLCCWFAILLSCFAQQCFRLHIFMLWRSCPKRNWLCTKLKIWKL